MWKSGSSHNQVASGSLDVNFSERKKKYLSERFRQNWLNVHSWFKQTQSGYIVVYHLPCLSKQNPLLHGSLPCSLETI